MAQTTRSQGSGVTDKKPVGGRRDYQPGRPPKQPGERHVKIGFSVPPDVAEWLLVLDRRSEWLTEIVRRERDNIPTVKPPSK